MVKEFSTLGSCSSRNIFTNASNEGYKNFFKINYSLESVTLISLMSNPLEFDLSLLNSPTKYDNVCVYNDFIKQDFLNFIKKNKIDYLVLDTYFDVLYDVIVVDNNTFISDSERLRQTDLSNLFKNNERISISNDLNRFMKIWINACDSFFNLIGDCNNTKVILNCSRPVYKYFSSSNNGIVDSFKLKKIVPSYHRYFRDILDTYILKNYDVYALPFDYTTLSDENHIWGLHPTHYEPRYYKDKTNQINQIIKLNEQYKYRDKINLEFRDSVKNKIISEFKSHKSFEFQYKKNMGIYESISKYLTVRIDIKNEGNELNSINILEISDKDASITFPPWFCDNAGDGMSIQSKQGKLTFKIKCINSGNLLIRFMGMDIRDERGIRVPIYIKISDIFINGDKIIEHDEIVCHDKSVKFRKMVENSEIISISLSWAMF